MSKIMDCWGDEFELKKWCKKKKDWLWKLPYFGERAFVKFDIEFKVFYFYFSCRRNGCILHSGVHQSFERLPCNPWQLNKLENMEWVKSKHLNSNK